MTELLLGCGHRREKLLGLPGSDLKWKFLYTLDINEKCKPDILCDLDSSVAWDLWSIDSDKCTMHGLDCIDTPVSSPKIKESYFDEVHAYEVLEHLGRQGHAPSFFATFSNIHRILKPNGFLFATVPSRYSAWLWGDPSHRRVILKESLVFLDQQQIRANRAAGTAMSDFSYLWTQDFRIISSRDNHTNHVFCLQAIK